jgi:hypothetical protein
MVYIDLWKLRLMTFACSSLISKRSIISVILKMLSRIKVWIYTLIQSKFLSFLCSFLFNSHPSGSYIVKSTLELYLTLSSLFYYGIFIYGARTILDYEYLVWLQIMGKSKQ